jgi:hypothetical protein
MQAVLDLAHWNGWRTYHTLNSRGRASGSSTTSASKAAISASMQDASPSATGFSEMSTGRCSPLPTSLKELGRPLPTSLKEFTAIPIRPTNCRRL